MSARQCKFLLWPVAAVIVLSACRLPDGCRSLSAAEFDSARPKYNVMFITVDDLRPVLGCYGDLEVKTPNLDALAARGTVFRRAYCQLPSCLPSRTSVLTGLRPETTGVLTNGDLNFRSRFRDHVTLPQHFKNHGAFCMSFGKMFHRQDPASWSTQKWIPKGNPCYPIYGKPETIALQVKRGSGPRKPSDWWGFQEGRNTRWAKALAWEAPEVPDNVLFDGQLADAVIRELRKGCRERFFLAPGCFRPHLPFVAPKPYFDMYPLDSLKLPANRNLSTGAPSFVHYDSAELRSYMDMPKRGQPIPEEKQIEVLRAYYAAVTYVDAQIGRMLDELDRLKLTRQTVVVLWSDHGYHFGEHGTWNKLTNFEEATRSTLIVSVPGQLRPGTTADGLVELVDLYPTLCELCALPVPEGLEGASFATLLDEPDRPGKRVALSQANPRGRMGHTMCTDRYRYTEWTHKGKLVAVELYDHQTDPGENVNLAARPESQALVNKFSKQLQAARTAKP